MANSWNESGTTWGTNRWGTTNAISSGWGADAWGTGGSWGKANDEVVSLTGLSLTSSVGVPLSCLLYTSPSPRDGLLSRMPSSA